MPRRGGRADPHLVDFIADPLKHGLEPQAIRGQAVQMVEDANEGMRRRRLAGVDLGSDEIERPLEPRDLEKRTVVGGMALRRSSCSRTICWTRRRLRFSEAATARIDSPLIRRAKIRRARLCSSVKNWTGFGAGAGMQIPFGERVRIALIP